MDHSAQEILDALPDGVVVADGEGAVMLVSAVAARMLGSHDPVGKPLADVLTLRDQEGNDWVGTNVPYDALPNRRGVPEQSWFLPNGTEVLVTARIRRQAPDGPISRVSICLRSGRGRERLDRERSDLVATVAHELRSPLTGVKGFVQAMLNRWDKLNDEQKKLMLTTVNADADRLSRLITELLDVARIDTGRLSMYPRASDFSVLVDRIVASVTAGTHRPVLTDIADDLPEIEVDPDKFSQVVTNLIENGIRHGDGTVLVTARRVETPYLGVRMTVDDEGEGIAHEIRRRVFTKFWKHGSRGGSGLGMYIVNGLVKAHGGSVEIGDSPAGGARISVVWPSEQPKAG